MNDEKYPNGASQVPRKPFARLTWDEGAGQKEQLIDKGELNIGRSSENDFVIKDSAASRYHCKIIRQAESFMVVDLDSTNGTFINYKRVIGSKALNSGDKLQIGGTEYKFEAIIPGTETIVLPKAEILPLESQIAVPSKVLEVQPEAQVIEEVIEIVEQPLPERPELAPIKGPTLIEADNLVKDFESPGGTVRVLKGVNLQIFAGEFVGIRGPSGSGKSTLLNMITGIDRPSSGEVVVSGQSLNQLSENKMARWRGEHIGVIFQFFQLLPTLTIIENVMLPMDFCRMWNARERQDRAMALLERVELVDQAFKLPSTLSGGQQQRAAIARALANDPPLIVADEPTGNLDSKTADNVFALFKELVTQGTTFLMVTHDVDLAKRIPRVIEVLDGELHER